VIERLALSLFLFYTFREMFWSDWGKNPKIEKSDMDGKNRVVLIKSGITWPNGLAIDIYNPKLRKLYYTDASTDIIGSYDLHTGVNKVNVQTPDVLQTPSWARRLLSQYTLFYNVHSWLWSKLPETYNNLRDLHSKR
jgi:hypothetical protein